MRFTGVSNFAPCKESFIFCHGGDANDTELGMGILAHVACVEVTSTSSFKVLKDVGAPINMNMEASSPLEIGDLPSIFHHSKTENVCQCIRVIVDRTEVWQVSNLVYDYVATDTIHSNRVLCGPDIIE